jgi:hypothetical protein
VNIADIFDNLHDNEGIWRLKSDSYNPSLSYPEDGNDICYQIEDHSFWFRHRNNLINWAIHKFANPSALFLDIGGGNGFVSKHLQKHGIETILLEPGLKGCLNAQKRGVTNIINASIEQLNFTNPKIQSIGLFDVVEHIEDDLNFLRCCQGLLQEHGLIFITVPAFNFLWSQEDREAGHYKRYTLGQIKEVATNAGFKVKYCSYFFSFLVLPVLFLRTLPSVLFKNRPLKAESEHSSNSLFGKTALNYLSSTEYSMFKKGRSPLFGTSCILVAEKC